MNRKSTLLAVVLMAVSSFTMNATELGSTNDFFYLKSAVVASVCDFRDLISSLSV